MSSSHTLQLQPDRPQRLEAAQGAELRVDTGIVWVTAGDAAGDVLLKTGQHYRVPCAGVVVAEALQAQAIVCLDQNLRLPSLAQCKPAT